jgi:hypothetical protein
VVQKGIPKPNDLPGQDAKIRRVAIHTRCLTIKIAAKI